MSRLIVFAGTEMTLNMKDPASIRAWVAVSPERHRAVLRVFYRMWPQFRGEMESAMRDVR